MKGKRKRKERKMYSKSARKSKKSNTKATKIKGTLKVPESSLWAWL